MMLLRVASLPFAAPTPALRRLPRQFTATFDYRLSRRLRLPTRLRRLPPPTAHIITVFTTTSAIDFLTPFTSSFVLMPIRHCCHAFFFLRVVDAMMLIRR